MTVRHCTVLIVVRCQVALDKNALIFVFCKTKMPPYAVFYKNEDKDIFVR
jgi:hypothetical protein